MPDGIRVRDKRGGQMYFVDIAIAAYRAERGDEEQALWYEAYDLLDKIALEQTE